MPRRKKLDFTDISISYHIHSTLGEIESSRYQQHIVGEVALVTEYGAVKEKIGQIIGDKMLIDSAANMGIGAVSVFDNEGHLFEIGQMIYDFRTNYFTEEITRAYEPYLSDVLVLTRIEILPKFRGARLGRYLIKDFYTNFISGCGLMVLKCFPIQFEYGLDAEEDEWTKSMQYGSFEKDQEKAMYTLLHFYTSMGFDYKPEISKDLLFLSTTYVNEKLNKIILR